MRFKCLTGALVAMALNSLLSSTVAADGFKSGNRNGISPSYSDGIYTMRVSPDACSSRPYPEQSESDCEGGTRRAQIHTTTSAAQGQTWEYGFNFFVPEDFYYVPAGLTWEMGHHTDDERFLMLSRINMAEWKKNRPKNHIYHLKLDSILGVTFLDRVCVGPEKFGRWVDFKMLANWGENGFVQVKCDETIIFEALTDTSTNPFCIPQLHCVPGLQNQAARVNQPLDMFIGITAEACNYGMPTHVPAAGYELRYRNPYAKRADNPKPLYVRLAQQALLDAGFDPNGVDGQVGAGTRRAIKAFQKSRRLETSGKFDVATYAALNVGAGIPVPRRSGVHSPDHLQSLKSIHANLIESNSSAGSEMRDYSVRLIAEDIFDRGSSTRVIALFHARDNSLPPEIGSFKFDLKLTIANDQVTGVDFRIHRPLGARLPIGLDGCAKYVRGGTTQQQYFVDFGLSKTETGFGIPADPCFDKVFPPIFGFHLDQIEGGLPQIMLSFSKTDQFKRLKNKHFSQFVVEVAESRLVIATE